MDCPGIYGPLIGPPLLHWFRQNLAKLKNFGGAARSQKILAADWCKIIYSMPRHKATPGVKTGKPRPRQQFLIFLLVIVLP